MAHPVLEYLKFPQISYNLQFSQLLNKYPAAVMELHCFHRKLSSSLTRTWPGRSLKARQFSRWQGGDSGSMEQQSK